MSVKWMSLVWADAPVVQTKLLILLALADHANDEGQCWPSITTIAKKARCSRAWVFEALKDLEEIGWCSRIGNHGPSNLYQLSVPATSPETGRVQKLDGSTGVDSTSQVGLTQTIKEPPIQNPVVVTTAGTEHWHPHPSALTTATQIAPLLDLPSHAIHYELWCIEKKRTPYSSEWLKWVTRDQQRLVTEQAAADKAANSDPEWTRCG